MCSPISSKFNFSIYVKDERNKLRESHFFLWFIFYTLAQLLLIWGYKFIVEKKSFLVVNNIDIQSNNEQRPKERKKWTKYPLLYCFLILQLINYLFCLLSSLLKWIEFEVDSKILATFCTLERLIILSFFFS